MASGNYVGGPNNSDDGEAELIFEFDKFMDDITKRETRKVLQEEKETVLRRYNRLHRERWQNRTRIQGK